MASPFLRRILTLLVGTSVAQAIPIAISPILTRLYTPSDLGVLAIFTAVAGVLVVFATGGYELAVVLPTSEEEALQVAALAQVINLSVSSVLLVAIAFLDHPLATALGNSDLRPYLYLVPVAVFLTGTYSVLNYYATRTHQYRDISRTSVVRSLAGAVVQVVAGIFTQGPGGLVVGQTVSAGAANLSLARSLMNTSSLLRVSRAQMYARARQYRTFPAFAMPSNLLNSIALNIVNMLFPLYYSVSTLGQYALVRRVMGIPSVLISNAVAQVFYKSAIDEKHQHGSAARTFRSTGLALSACSVAVFLPLFLLAPSIFTLVFGDQWTVAGQFARITIPVFAVRFVVTPLTMANPMNNKNGLELFGNIVLLSVTVAAIVGAGVSGWSAQACLTLLTVAQCIYYVGFAMAIRSHVVKDSRR